MSHTQRDNPRDDKDLGNALYTLEKDAEVSVNRLNTELSLLKEIIKRYFMFRRGQLLQANRAWPQSGLLQTYN
jgi:hypothetical protein